MGYEVRKTRKKIKTVYKSLYLPEGLNQDIEDDAIKENTSFNNIVVSMIKYYLEEEE